MNVAVFENKKGNAFSNATGDKPIVEEVPVVVKTAQYKITKELTLTPVIPANVKVTADYSKPVIIPVGTLVDGIEKDEVSPCLVAPCPTHKVLAFSYNGKDFKTVTDYEKVTIAGTVESTASSIFKNANIVKIALVLGVTALAIWFIEKGKGVQNIVK